MQYCWKARPIVYRQSHSGNISFHIAACISLPGTADCGTAKWRVFLLEILYLGEIYDHEVSVAMGDHPGCQRQEALSSWLYLANIISITEMLIHSDCWIPWLWLKNNKITVNNPSASIENLIETLDLIRNQTSIEAFHCKKNCTFIWTLRDKIYVLYLRAVRA